jgi:hypothetical protein
MQALLSSNILDGGSEQDFELASDCGGNKEMKLWWLMS